MAELQKVRSDRQNIAQRLLEEDGALETDQRRVWADILKSSFDHKPKKRSMDPFETFLKMRDPEWWVKPPGHARKANKGNRTCVPATTSTDVKGNAQDSDFRVSLSFLHEEPCFQRAAYRSKGQFTTSTALTIESGPTFLDASAMMILYPHQSSLSRHCATT